MNFGEKADKKLKKVVFFNDEFTNYNDTHQGKIAIKLLTRLGYEVLMPQVNESGRTWISKGLLLQAQKIALSNIKILGNLVSDEAQMIGIEPSAILTFRDEYLDLTKGKDHEIAQKIARNTFFIDEFISNEILAGNITSEQFTENEQLVKLHGHCHQKALSSLTHTKRMLSLPKNYTLHIIPSGCCGMAGSFGYEKEHYDVSMQIGELVLFPAVRQTPENVIVAAPGTSCRHQIKDGTDRKAIHTVEVLYNALR